MTDAPTSFADLGLRAELLDALDRPRLRGADADPARGDPAAARGPRPARPGRHRHRQDGRVRAAAAPAARRRRASGASPSALVLVPTRELAMQVAEAIHRYGRGLGARVLPIYGGQPIGRQLRALRARRRRRRRHARAGRSTTSAAARCSSTRVRGRRARRGRRDARHGLRRGHRGDPRRRRRRTGRPCSSRRRCRRASTASPGATCATRCASRSAARGGRAGRGAAGAAERVRRRRARTSPPRSAACSTSRRPTAAIVFCRTRDEVDQLTETLNGRGYRAEALHGGMSQEQRDRVMGRLRARHRRPAGRHRRRRPRARHRPAHARRQLRRAVGARGVRAPHRPRRAGPAARAWRSRSPSRASTGMLKTIERRHRAADRDREGADGRRPARPPAGADPRGAARERSLEDDLDRFRVVVETLADEFDVMEVALAAVKLAHEATGGADGDERGDPRRRRAAASDRREPRRPREPRDGPRGGAAAAAGRRMTRLFVGAGPQRRHPPAGPRRRDRRRVRPERPRHRRHRDRRPVLAGRGARRPRPTT